MKRPLASLSGLPLASTWALYWTRVRTVPLGRGLPSLAACTAAALAWDVVGVYAGAYGRNDPPSSQPCEIHCRPWAASDWVGSRETWLWTASHRPSRRARLKVARPCRVKG